MPHQAGRPRVGEHVVLVAVPPGLLDGLPDEDREAITAIVGRPVQLVGYDEDGRAELHFNDPFDPPTGESSNTHSIWVAPEFISRFLEQDEIQELATARHVDQERARRRAASRGDDRTTSSNRATIDL